MTRPHARFVANALVGCGLALAAAAVVRSPLLRRAAWIAASTTIPGYLLNEVITAWRETGGREAPQPAPRLWKRAA